MVADANTGLGGTETVFLKERGSVLRLRGDGVSN